MAWTYRTDKADQVLAAGRGPVTVVGHSTEYSADGALDPTLGFLVLTKTSAGAYTLAAPTDDGQAVEITAGTAYAHVVTATGLIQDGVTGGAKATWTSAAFVGSALKLRGWNGKWHVISKNLGTVA